ncbi:MAG: class I SAM-dependent methyltransferase [Labilithrix sp.]|nr:class I SAM-dependent methyltransferase [Labilithrix sp.]
MQEDPPPIRSTSVCPVCAARPRALRGGGCPDAWLCPRCGHTFVSVLPTASELEDTYEDYGYGALDDASLPKFLDRILEDRLASFDRHRSTNRILDVGFGAGGLLRVARGRGWDTFGVERSPAAVRYAKAKELGTIVLGDFLTADLERGSFDVVVMSELLEHLIEPLPFLERAAELLRPGGLLYATTPHGRGVSGRALGSSWSVLRPPEHLQLFSIRSMRRSLARAGFRRIDVYTQGLLPHELVTAVRSKLSTSSGSKGGARFEGRVTQSYRLNESLMSNTGGRALKSTANVVLRALRLGDSLRVEAER